jgi:hypothetical protein
MYFKSCSSRWPAKGVIKMPPKALVLFLLNDCQNLVFCLLVLLLPGGLKTAIQVLSSIVLAMLPEIITLFDGGLEAQVYFFGGERHGVRNVAPSSRLLEVALVFDSFCLEPEKGPVDLHATYPLRCFGRKWNPT